MSGNKSETSREDGSQRESEELMLQTRMEKIGRKILVLSGKGGVGKSTVAVNLAMSLALAGRKVGLLDVDIHGPSIPKILGLDGQRLGPDATGGIAPIQFADNLKVVSVGLLLDNATDAVIWRGPMKYNVIRQFLKDVAWGEIDCLVVDSPPGTGDEPLSVAQMVGNDAWALVVTTPQDVAISDVRRSVSFCRRLSLRILGIVENMSGLVCPHCGRQVDLFKVGGGQKLATEMNVPFLGRIPLDPAIVDSGDAGKPFVKHYTDSPSTQAFMTVIEPILNQAGENRPLTPTPPHKEISRMRIAIPTVDGKLCMHFGHADQFAFVDVNETDKAILSTDYLSPPGHEPGVLPRWLREQGAGVIIAGGMGQRAQNLFTENGIEVVVGASPDTPENIVSAYLGGALLTGANVCDH